jgi:predicted AlkP superfamily pyrophosphatase or phosphodiesterase
VAYCSIVLWCGRLCASAQPGDPWKGPLVIVIGVDGLSTDGVVKAKDPQLRQLMEHSAWTLEARGVMPTLSSPNWESMITGAGPEQHGITSNGILGHMARFQPVCRDAEGQFPTMFQVLRTQRPTARIAIFHEWAGFAGLLEKDVPDVLQHESSHQRTAQAAMEYWKANHPALLFVHLDNVDHTGHDEGWGTAAYYRAVADADRHIGQFLDMVHESGVEDRTYILVTSDHGGKGRNHGKSSLVEIQIPWVIAGPDIAPGRLKSAVYIYDTAATIAWIFGLNPPDCWIGRPMLTAFQAATVAARSASHTTPVTQGCEPPSQRAVITVGVGASQLTASPNMGSAHTH